MRLAAQNLNGEVIKMTNAVKQKIIDAIAKLPVQNPTQRNIVATLTDRVTNCSWQISHDRETVGVAINLFKSSDPERLALALQKFKEYLAPILALNGDVIDDNRIYVNLGIWRNNVRLVIQLRKASQRRKSQVNVNLDEL